MARKRPRRVLRGRGRHNPLFISWAILRGAVPSAKGPKDKALVQPFLLAQRRTARLRASLALLGRRTARNDAAACQDEPIAAPFLNSQDAPRPRDRISGRYLLRTIATVNHGDAVPCILDAIVSEQGPRVVGSGCFNRGGRIRPCHKRRLFRRGRREGIGRTCARGGGSLLQLVEPCRETSNF